MLVLIDKYIPFLQGVLEPFAEVLYLEPEAFTPQRVHDADALIIRTRTKCDAALLEGSRVRFIATATIGYDHIDRTWCAEHGIEWVSCPGCNSQAVCDYVEEVLRMLPEVRSVGVVGVGHVGSKVSAMASRRGLAVVENDPPKGILGDVSGCDLITFHTPLDDTTRHLCDATYLLNIQPHAVIVNAARGGIVDEIALLNSGHKYVIDCWENEPHIRREVLLNERLIAGSFHIAGYSIEGKQNASQMCLDAFSHFFGCPALKCQINSVPLQGDSKSGWLQRLTAQLQMQPEAFEQLRKAYPLR